MLVRLLLVVAMLAGPIPVRICTCAAGQNRAVPSAPSATHSVSFPSDSEAETCGCGHRSKKKRTVGTSTTATPKHTASHDDSAGHSEQHDRDCPAVKAAAHVVVGVVGGAGDADLHCFDLAPLSHEILADDSARLSSHSDVDPPSRSVPLYISLLTLRN